MSDNGDTTDLRDAAAAAASSELLGLIATGRAQTRVDLARLTGLAPSTISLRVQELIDAGLLLEDGEAPSQGGRRARLLRLSETPAFYVADLGGSHARIGLASVTGSLEHVQEVGVDIAAGPVECLGQVVQHLRDLAKRERPGEQIRGIGLALPGPVNPSTGTVTVPSRMPGWRGFQVATWLEDELQIPAVVDNDANLMALGEHEAAAMGPTDTVTIKAGTAIGAGVISQGRIHRGATFFAGDITHVKVPAAGDYPCSCGNFGCLETIASGAALTRTLAANGLAVTSTAEVVALAQQGHPLATTSVRTAGAHLGEALCMVVNFFNPQAVFLGGALSSAQLFVAAVRSSLYEGCHPLATERLTIARTITGRNAGLLGAARLILDRLTLVA